VEFYFNRIPYLNRIILRLIQKTKDNLLKTPGRKRPPDAEFLLSQIKDVFKKKKDELGAERAAKQLNVCLASFYKYVNGTNLPDMKVLRNAEEKWGIKWKYLDASEVLKIQKVRTPEQLVFSFLDALHEEDVEVVEVGPVGKSVLRVMLKIRFPT